MQDYLKHVQKLIESGIPLSDADYMAFREGDTLYISKAGNLAKLKDSDFTAVRKSAANNPSVPPEDAYMAALCSVLCGKDAPRVAFITRPTYASEYAKCGKTLPSVLDDQAQIIGVSLKIATDPSQFVKKLHGRSALLLSDGRLLSVGRTFEEACTATLVAEKACYCHIYAAKIGGAKKIPTFEAILMHFIYKKKYSAKNIQMQQEVAK